MGGLAVYRLTKAGDRIASNSKPRGRNRILDYLHTTGPASEDDIVGNLGPSMGGRSAAAGQLRSLVRKHLIEEMGSRR